MRSVDDINVVDVNNSDGRFNVYYGDIHYHHTPITEVKTMVEVKVM